MTKRNLYSTCLSLITMLFVIIGAQPLVAQTAELNITGVVTESGTGLPLEQVSVSVASTGNVAKTNENGEFSIAVPDLNSELIFNYPGYTRRNIFLLKTGSSSKLRWFQKSTAHLMIRTVLQMANQQLKIRFILCRRSPAMSYPIQQLPRPTRFFREKFRG